jgi:hypothetical protein
MFICVGGDIHGALDRFYADVLCLEASLGIRLDWVLHVGDFGIWPDPARMDRATRNHDGAGDFPRWLAEKRAAPRPTVFIKGNHEDFEWLEAQRTTEVLSNLWYLPNGCTMDLPDGEHGSIRIGGIGGCYGPSNYERPSSQLKGYAKRHYTQDEIERLKRANGVDIILTHDAPAGVEFPTHRRGRGYVSNAAGLDSLLAFARPRLAFFGHHHTRIDAQISGVRCIGLNKVAMPGNLIAIEIEHGKSDWQRLGESG